VFRGHETLIAAVAVFPDGRRIVTSSYDETLCVWDLGDGAMLRELMGHHSWVRAVAVSGDGELIASGDQCGDLIVWDGLEDAQAGESLTWQGINGHNGRITSLDFSPDRKMLASVSSDNTIKYDCGE